MTNGERIAAGAAIAAAFVCGGCGVVALSSGEAGRALNGINDRLSLVWPGSTPDLGTGRGNNQVQGVRDLELNPFLASPTLLHEGDQDAQADWGYGPWGNPGVKYVKIQPEGEMPMGVSQGVTDFNGRNWVKDSVTCWTVPAEAQTIEVLTQGDAPAEYDFRGNRLCMTSNAGVSARASLAIDEAPMPEFGSSGISAIVNIK